MSHDTPKSHAEAVTKLAELIRGIRFAMLTTLAPDGTLHSRPMATREDDFDGVLWFFTGADSGKSHEIADDARVNLSYGDPDGNRYVSVSGTARTLRDPVKAKELWNPLLKAWFPKGLEDPNLALLKVTVTAAEYWDGPSAKLEQLMGLVKAVVTGKPADGGEHAKIRL